MIKSLNYLKNKISMLIKIINNAKSLLILVSFFNANKYKKRTLITQRSFCWCGKEDLNPHSEELDPKSSASASSATPAWGG